MQELAATVAERRARIKDYEVNTAVMGMDATTNRFNIGTNGNTLTVDGNELFHDQVADRLSIPHNYYRRMRTDSPALLAQNVNTWLHRWPETRLVRTYAPPAGADIRPNVAPADRAALTVPNIGRAFLSDRYRPLDNGDLINAMLPPLMESGLRALSTQITDSRLYLQLVTERITAEVKVGDAVQMGLVVSNSETGCGALSISVMVFRLACLNGMIIPGDDSGFRKAHLGGRIFAESDAYLTSDTRKKKDAALWGECRDVIAAAVTQTNLDKIVARIKGAADYHLNDAVKSVELVSDRYGLHDDEQKTMLNYLIAGGDPTKWGLINAITRTAEDVPNYDRAIELETIGGQLVSSDASVN